MMNVARGAVCNLARNAAARRGLATSRTVRAVEEMHPGYKSIRAKQDRFGTDDAVPVHIKGGALDSILYGITMSACVGAVGWECAFFYELAQK